MFTTHIGNAWDGAIVQFSASARYFMKVCNAKDGTGGVVDIIKGQYIPTRDLDDYKLGTQVCIIAMNLEDFVTDKED